MHIPKTCSFDPAKSIVFTPRICCPRPVTAARDTTGARGRMASTKVKLRRGKLWIGAFCLEATLNARAKLRDAMDVVVFRDCLRRIWKLS